jgi:hypothetical protein
MAFFIYKVSGEVMAKFRQNLDLCQKVKSVQFFPNSENGHVPIVVTPKVLSVWSHEMNHWNVEIVTYRVGIQQFGSFRFA